VPRLGTLPLAVRAARGPPSRGQPGWLALHSRPPLSGRQVLLFRASARDELTPPLHRALPGQHAGRPLAEGTHPRAFVPEALYPSGFDAIVPPIDASAVVHTRSSSRRTPDPLTAGLFPQRSPPRLLTGAACGGLGSPPARRTRRTYLHHWHSTVHAGDLLHRLTPLSGRTTERRLSEVINVYAAPDQDVCGVDTVVAQRPNRSHSVLKAAATRRAAPGLRRRH
jgi:hypothetical protein